MSLFWRRLANYNYCDVLALTYIVKLAIEQSRRSRTATASDLIRVSKRLPYFFKEFWNQIGMSVCNVHLTLIG